MAAFRKLKEWARQKPGAGAQLDRQDPINTGLVGCWLMNEGGGRIAKEIALGNPGALSASSAVWAPGRFGTSLSFGGSGDITVARASAYNFTTGNFALSFWLWENTSGGNYMVMGNGIAGTNGWYVYIPGTNRYMTMRFQTPTEVTLSTNPIQTTLNQWEHWVINRTGTSTGEIYRNGILAVSGSAGSPVTTSASLYMGRYAGGGFNFTGRLDHVRIYNRVLRQREAQRLFTEPFAGIARNRYSLARQAVVGGTRPVKMAGYWGGYAGNSGGFAA